MEKTLVIDASEHVVGKLAAVVAKKLLKGYKVTVLCIESARFTGPLHRQVGKYKSFKEKRAPYNPERGSFHWSEPSKYFKHKLFRGMVPRKTARGAAAIANLTVYEGIPKQFENVERSMVPKALLKVTTDVSRPSCTLGELLSNFGWHHAKLCQSLVDALKTREAEFNAAKAETDAKRDTLVGDNAFISEVDRRMAEFA
ncbi:large subunit ribosomal protein L13Ae [Pancytospora philotis]|nr:large subunit ribosomal protein L13Ae [Pancytospora philotis]